MNKTRILWIDWMKVLAMFLIIAGHLSVPGNRFIYVFSVPSFFILSGFLFKKEPWSDHLKKTFWNLFIPMMALLLINLVYRAIANDWGLIPVGKVILRSLAGYQGQNYAYGGLGALWFVYTLIVSRLLMQLICSLPAYVQKTVLALVNTVFLIGCVIYNHHEVSPYLQFNSIVNVLLAFPFFSIGFLLTPFKERISSFPLNAKTSLLFLVSIIIILICGKVNGLVYLYMCSYGDFLSLCLLGGTVGFYFLLFLSKIGETLIGGNIIIDSLGQGTIIILGLHVMLMTWLKNIRSALWNTEYGFDLYFLALLTLLAFVPINLFFKRYLPILYGRMRLHKP